MYKGDYLKGIKTQGSKTFAHSSNEQKNAKSIVSVEEEIVPLLCNSKFDNVSKLSLRKSAKCSKYFGNIYNFFFSASRETSNDLNLSVYLKKWR